MSRKNVLLAVLSVGGSMANGGPAAAVLCSSLVDGPAADGQRDEVVGDRMLIVEARRRERALRKEKVKRVVKNALGWTRKAACLA
jgi:hypothetical protein